MLLALQNQHAAQGLVSKLIVPLVIGIVVACTNLLGLTDEVRSQEDLTRLKDFSIDRLVRFSTSQEAEATRTRLIRAIWPDGLPKVRPKVSSLAVSAEEIASIDNSLVAAAFQYDVDVSQLDWHALVVVVQPKQMNEGLLAIVQGGHMREGASHYLDSGLSDSANQLLKAGYTVALVQMPLVGWNRDATATIDGQKIEVSKRGTAGHNELFQLVEPKLRAGTMRIFLEPITQSLNEMIAVSGSPKKILMIGLSGGGWTTHLYAAVDTRIDVSLPVAGAYPLYARGFSRGSRGDAEQEYAPIFGEKDSDGDGITDTATGVASWCEVFALGGLSPNPNRPRKQVQVLNLYDSCCFHGKVYESYSGPLSKRVEAIGTGSWQVYSDDSHRDHMISPQVRAEVLAKEM